MKVLILGGTGVFGERLARLLARDGHELTIAARTLPAAQALARELGAQAQQIDRNGDLSALPGHEVVIDAAGPFHAYGADPYRVARAALAAGAHYLDLADNAAFCAGITALDAEAQAADKAAISGLSVMASILSQSGRPYPLFQSGRWITATGWSAPQDYALPGGITRQGWRIEVPDTRLFPAHFRADTVDFRAGLELGLMRYGLAAFALVRRALPIPVTTPLVRAFRLAADFLAPFGTGTGGMSVTITTATHRHRWTLLAENGDGPFVPAIAIRALLRRPTLPTLATPALEIVTLQEIEAAMSDFSIRFERQSQPLDPIFPRTLGPAFTTLPDAIRATHLTAATTRWTGRASVTRGASLWSRLLSTLFRFPPATEDTEVEVTKTATATGETWTRRFGRRTFRSHLKPTPQGMTERFGPFTFTLGLTVKDGALHYPVAAGRIGPSPLPRWLHPASETREYEQNGRFHFDVRLLAPVTGGLMVHYRGHLIAALPESPDPPQV